ncbi:uncharacterized protein LOC142980587 [Anticarsia gemmatalis]|uniref:uncharacterized protein LOC142980587 n=1 Tax=Anticarsia gemmatalis TaxID=129554 RepID=UPI003F76F2A9
MEFASCHIVVPQVGTGSAAAGESDPAVPAGRAPSYSGEGQQMRSDSRLESSVVDGPSCASGGPGCGEAEGEGDLFSSGPPETGVGATSVAHSTVSTSKPSRECLPNRDGKGRFLPSKKVEIGGKEPGSSDCAMEEGRRTPSFVRPSSVIGGGGGSRPLSPIVVLERLPIHLGSPSGRTRSRIAQESSVDSDTGSDMSILSDANQPTEIGRLWRKRRPRPESEESDGARKKKKAPAKKAPDSDPEEKSAKQLADSIQDNLEAVVAVADKSGNLKGTFIKSLKDAARNIRLAVSELSRRSATNENLALQAQNSRLKAEVDHLNKEMAALKSVVENISNTTNGVQPVTIGQAPPSVERAIADLRLMVDARFGAIEARLPPEPRIRPPLAADKKAAGAPPVPAARATKTAAPTPAARKDKAAEPPSAPATKPATAPNPPAPLTKAGKRGKKAKPSYSAVAAMPAKEAPAIPATANEWQLVGKNGKAAKAPKEKAPKNAKKKASKKKAAKLRTPKSAAVVITLQPEAAKNGATYKDVIGDAKSKINLADLGIGPNDVRFKVAATGARMFELPGTSGAEKADAFALKLREVLGEDIVRVSRPTKSAELRIMGLDDSASPEEVRAALSRAGECPADSVRLGQIRLGPHGGGSIWACCPVAAAKKIVDGRRLLIGWVSARVELLPPRERRCYRCLEGGHVCARCTSEVDRSGTCFRCGKPGHIARSCSEAPNCAVCAAAGKPAAHVVGSKACAPPKIKKKRNLGENSKNQNKKKKKKTAKKAKAASQSADRPAASNAAEVPADVVEMETQH